jgi:hypothetical protein
VYCRYAAGKIIVTVESNNTPQQSHDYYSSVVAIVGAKSKSPKAKRHICVLLEAKKATCSLQEQKSNLNFYDPTRYRYIIKHRLEAIICLTGPHNGTQTSFLGYLIHPRLSTISQDPDIMITIDSAGLFDTTWQG